MKKYQISKCTNQSKLESMRGEESKLIRQEFLICSFIYGK